MRSICRFALRGFGKRKALAQNRVRKSCHLDQIKPNGFIPFGFIYFKL